MNSENKSTKSIVVSTRLNEHEFAEMQLKLIGSNGKPMMKPAAFLKAAATGAVVTVIDAELEQYRVFIEKRASNNLNQIAKRLNTDHLAGKINNKTYEDVLSELVKISASFIRY
jgi:hypothetical protein